MEAQFENSLAYLEPRVDDPVDEAIDRAVRHPVSIQSPEGYWQGELESDTTLVSDYIFYLHILGKPSRSRIAKLANTLRSTQLPDGGWNTYAGGPAQLDPTVKAYFALKLAGDAVNARHMSLARECVRHSGGLERANSYTRLYLALCGLVGWEMVPAIPPEQVLLPAWFPGNI